MKFKPGAFIENICFTPPFDTSKGKARLSGTFTGRCLLAW